MDDSKPQHEERKAEEEAGPKRLQPERQENPVSLRIIDEDQPEEVPLLTDEGVVPVVRLELPKPIARKEESPAQFLAKSYEPDVEDILEAEIEQAALERQWQNQKQKSHKSIGWFFLIFLLLIGLVLFGIVKNSVNTSKQEIGENVILERVEKKKLDYQEAQATVEELEKGVRHYLASTSIEDLLTKVHNPQRVQPLMEDWYTRHPFDLPQPIQRMGSIQPLITSSKELWIVEVISPDRAPYAVIMTIEDGVAKVDWDTTVLYQPVDWEIYSEQPTPGESLDFRVICRDGSEEDYILDYADRKQWQSYQLTAKNSLGMLIGYVPRDSDINHQLRQFLHTRGEPFSLLLRLHRRPDTQVPHSADIVEIVSEDWIIPD